MAGKPPLYSEEQVRAFGAMYWSPERPNLDTVARAAHCTRSTLARYFTIHGIPLRKRGAESPGPPRALSEEDVQVIDFLYSLGQTQGEIGQALNVSRTTISDYMIRYGIPTRHRRQYTKAVGYRIKLSDEERERRSRVLRERWERGEMDHVAEARRRAARESKSRTDERTAA